MCFFICSEIVGDLCLIGEPRTPCSTITHQSSYVTVVASLKHIYANPS